MFELFVGVAALALSGGAGCASEPTPMPAAAVQAAPSGPPTGPPPVARLLAPGAYWVPGMISNAGFIVGDAGVIAIDTQISIPAARAFIGAIGAVTNKPVDTVILTHSDPDHINGLPAFPHGIAVIAQTRTKAEIEGVIANPNSNGLPPPAEIRDYVPTRTIEASETLTLDGVPMTLIHTGSAHTDGDLIVYLPEQKLVYAGDLLTPAIGPYPGIHLDKHGSSMGWIASVQALLALDANTFVSGHGEPLTRADVITRLEAARARRAEIAALVGQGMTLPQIKEALHDAPLPGPASRFPTFVETTFQELTAH